MLSSLPQILIVSLMLGGSSLEAQHVDTGSAAKPPDTPIAASGSVGGGKKAANPWTPIYLANGEPDWQGFWRAHPGGDTYDITGFKPRPDYNLQGNGTPKPGIHRVSGTPDGRVPYQAWAAVHFKDTSSNVDDPTQPQYVDTQAHCLPDGPVRGLIHSGFELVQSPGYVVLLSEQADEQVIIPTDGRPHVPDNIHLWEGDRRGHWEGNTLVVDVTNVKGKSRLDMSGNFYGEDTHFVERFTRVDDNTINYEATIADPAVFTQPWTIHARFQRDHVGDDSYELWEDACHEGERSADRLVISPDAARINAEAAAKAQAASPTPTQQ